MAGFKVIIEEHDEEVIILGGKVRMFGGGPF
jgi:hypothetical protein